MDLIERYVTISERAGPQDPLGAALSRLLLADVEGRETELGMMFAGVTFYAGQGFMVGRVKAINSALELDNATVCVQTGTTSEANVADYFKTNNLKFQLLTFSNSEEATKAYDSGLFAFRDAPVTQRRVRSNPGA